MPLPNYSTPFTIAQVIDRIVRSGRITRVDENYFLHAMVAGTPLSHEEQSQVRNLFDRLQMGLLQVVD
ncbi:MAG: hypothetical protein KME42_10485 [Tildeniella nuda ZEHNDER 1965/U140]|jgi:hypothetical protein|nr:hypothetical protein [Tildeniella nuda ZEHNDER 1965/U140]